MSPDMLVDDPLPRLVASIDDMYNHAVAAYALSAAWELGLFDRLRPQRATVDLEAFAREEDLDLRSVQRIAHALALTRVLTLDEGSRVAAAGPLFGDAIAKKGFFYWLTRGCGELFATMPQMVRNSICTGEFVTRDFRAIGVAARDAGLSFVDEPFCELVERRGLRSGADLGCGSGQRLIELAERNPGFRGVGIDIAEGAVSLARQAVAEAALADRLTIMRGDGKRLQRRPEFLDIEFVSCFMMGHDLWPRAECIASLEAIGEAFPAATDLIMCDTYRSDLAPTERHPVFTLAFETAHAVMGQALPSLAEWADVFDATGWTMTTTIEFELPPYTALMHLTRSV